MSKRVEKQERIEGAEEFEGSGPRGRSSTQLAPQLPKKSPMVSRTPWLRKMP